jgi:hypothetical protein
MNLEWSRHAKSVISSPQLRSTAQRQRCPSLRARHPAAPAIGFLDSGYPDTFAYSRMGSVRVQPRLVGATPREVCYGKRRESIT